MISVKFFASLRERLGVSELKLAADELHTVHDVWISVTDFEMPANLLVAINHDYVGREHAVQDGDEVAFFPPVTGG
ncbi:MAG: molybdopterin converting factor subunit 1 [Pseudomonadota bacterium]